MFVTTNKVRLHDLDMAGRLYFPRQFRFAYDALEDLIAGEEYGFEYVFHKAEYVFAVVHCEADYFTEVKIGTDIETQLTVEHIGNSSFSIFYQFYSETKTLLGTAKTVHVVIDKKTGQKMPVPDELRSRLEKYMA